MRRLLFLLLSLLWAPGALPLARRVRNWRRIALQRRLPRLRGPAKPQGPPVKLPPPGHEDPLHPSDAVTSLKDLLNLQAASSRRKPPLRPDGVGLDDVVPATDLSPPHRKIWIVTTASMPWMTGTSVNPLLRAAHLTASRVGEEGGRVTLMVPFLDAKDQSKVFPKGVIFNTEAEQEDFLRTWLRETAQMPEAADALDVRFYQGRYHPSYASIFPLGDIVGLVPDDEADICVLEEPEHLNWFRFAGKSWKAKFKHVVGVMHTNYLAYSQDQASGRVKALFLLYINQWMCRAYCDRIIKLSSVLQDYALEKEVVCNVHGVRGDFISIGENVAATIKQAPAPAAEAESPPELPAQRFSSYYNMTANAKALRSAWENLGSTLAGDARAGKRGRRGRWRSANPLPVLTQALKEYQEEYEAARSANLEARLKADPKLKEIVDTELTPLEGRDATLDPEAIYNLSPMHALAVVQSGFTAFGNISDTASIRGRVRFGLAQGHRLPRIRYPRARVEEALAELDAAPVGLGEATEGGPFTEGLYFIGKSVWAKGHAKLMDLMAHALVEESVTAQVTIYGSGPDRQAIERRAHLTGLGSVLHFQDGVDHAKLGHFKAMVNPSESEVLCTTVAEALAMGKFVICADHPSNAFFRDFRNCLMFRTADDFTRQLRFVTDHEPAPLTEQERHVLTWEAATDRFAESSKLTYRMAAKSNENVDDLLHLLQRSLFDGQAGDTLRTLMGAGPVAKQYAASKGDIGQLPQ